MAAAPIEFETPRLALRRWRPEHRAPFAAMNADAEVMRHFPALQTEAESNASIDAWLAHFESHGWGFWAAERRDTGTFIGFIGLNVPRRVLPFSPCVEVGWRLQRSAWGQGFATEGGRACLRLGFEALGLAEIVSFTALGNHRSLAVMARIGLHDAHADFEHPGVPPGHALRRHRLYRITREQWRLGAREGPA